MSNIEHEGVQYSDVDNHRCEYRIIRKTIKFIGNSRVWAEKCRWCSRTKMVDYKFIVEGSKFPRLTIRWYDEFGNLDQETGDK